MDGFNLVRKKCRTSYVCSSYRDFLQTPSELKKVTCWCVFTSATIGNQTCVIGMELAKWLSNIETMSKEAPNKSSLENIRKLDHKDNLSTGCSVVGIVGFHDFASQPNTPNFHAGTTIHRTKSPLDRAL